MAYTKYRETFPTLAEGLAREGYTDVQIAERLGISKDTFYRYQKKHKAFKAAIERGKAPIDFRQESNLLKLADGYDYDETHKETRITLVPVQVGDKIEMRERKIVHVKTITRHVPPNLGAISKWLNNRRPDRWRDRQEIDLRYIDPLDRALQEMIAQMSPEQIRKLAFEDDASKNGHLDESE